MPQAVVALLNKSVMSVVDMVAVVSLVPVTVTAGSVVTSDDVPVPAPPVVVVACVCGVRFSVARGKVVSVTWNGSMTVTPGASVDTAPPRAAPVTFTGGWKICPVMVWGVSGVVPTVTAGRVMTSLAAVVVTAVEGVPVAVESMLLTGCC